MNFTCTICGKPAIFQTGEWTHVLGAEDNAHKFAHKVQL